MTLAISAHERVRWRAMERRADPLLNGLFSSVGQRELFEKVADFEVLWQAANGAGKTRGGAMLSTAFARGVKELDGRTIEEARNGMPRFNVRVPPIRVPNIGWCIIPGYKLSVDSVIEGLNAVLGKHPVHWVGSGGPIGFSAVHIQPDSARRPTYSSRMTVENNDHHDWSRLTFHVDEGFDPVGGRVDYAWKDEPGPEKVWREIRMRGRAGSPFYRFITATFKHRYGPQGWHWVPADFAMPGRCIIVTTMRENEALLPEDVSAREQAAAGDVLAKARLYGKLVDTSGACPYRSEHVERWRSRCRPPTRIDVVEILAASLDDSDREILPVSGDLRVFHDVEPHHAYRLVVDPSGGINDSDHDPEAFHVINETRRCLAARHRGYLEPYALAVMSDIVGRRYNNARNDVEMNKYGDTVVLGWRKRFYPNIGRSLVIAQPGEMREAYGWTATEVNRAQGIGAIQTALANDDFLCEDEDVIDCLANVILDPRGKPVAGPGYHDEDQTCLGWALRQMALTPAPSLPTPHIVTPEEIMEREMGIMRRARFQPPARQRWR